MVARINNPDNEWLFTEAWGVDVAVSTPRVLVALVEEAVSVGDLVRLMTFRQGQANLVEITLPDAAPVIGRPVRDMELPRDAALVAIVRGNRVVVPGPDEPLEGGDELLFVAVQDVETRLRQLVCGDGSLASPGGQGAAGIRVRGRGGGRCRGPGRSPPARSAARSARRTRRTASTDRASAPTVSG